MKSEKHSAHENFQLEQKYDVAFDYTIVAIYCVGRESKEAICE